MEGGEVGPPGSPWVPGGGAGMQTQPYRFPHHVTNKPSNVRQSLKSFTVDTHASPQVLLHTLSCGCCVTQHLSTPFHPPVLSLFLMHFKENCKHLYL